VRRHARDLALLVAIGGTRRQVEMATIWTALVVAVAAALVGVPFGLLVARLVWGEIAEGAGVADDLALPALVLWLVVAVPLVSVVVAAWPAHVGMRRATPDQLRTE